MRLAIAVALLLLASFGASAQALPATPAGPGTAATPPTALDRCEIGKRLAGTQPELAAKQLAKALDDPTTRQCALDALTAPAQPDGSPPPLSLCKAASSLRKRDLLDAAKTQYQKAVDADPPQRCGLNGLAAVAADEKKAADEKDRDDDRVSLDEAVDDVVDVFFSTWPWLAALALLALLRLFSPDRVAIQGPKDDEKLIKRVAAAAMASGGAGTPPSKVAVGPSEQISDSTVADVSKLLALPATAALSQLLKLASKVPLTSSRLTVSSAIAGGWAVIELDLRRTLSRAKKARIALPLGDLEEAKQLDVLGLAGGAWLVAQLQAGSDHSAIVAGDDRAAVYHACFRAGVNAQSRGEPETARACYSAMPAGVSYRDAPFAWVGARLNEMMLLATEHRWAEAAAFADVIEAYPKPIAGFDEDDLSDLRRRQRYMTAIVRVDHFYSLRSDGQTGSAMEKVREGADRATEALIPERDSDTNDGPATSVLRAAIRIVALAYRVAKGESVTTDAVEDELARGIAGAMRHGRPALGGAAYYDAACVVSMLAGRASKGSELQEQQLDYALELLETAMCATPKARQPRLSENAKRDEMLKPLRDLAAARFAEAIGEEPKTGSDPPQDTSPSLAEALASVLGGISGRPPTGG